MQNFMAIFTVPSRNSHLQAHDELYPIYFFIKNDQQKNVEKNLTHFFMVRFLRRTRFRVQKIGLLSRKVEKYRFLTGLFLILVIEMFMKEHLKRWGRRTGRSLFQIIIEK